jgi:parallel beta-helix repeat protein
MRSHIGLSLGLTLILSPLAVSRAATLYVSTEGHAGASGKIDAPLPSLAAARDKIRELRQSGDKSAMTVKVRGGTYFLEETFVLTPEDSGTKALPVTYEAYPGERVVISGGRRIVGGARQVQGPRADAANGGAQAQGQARRQRPTDMGPDPADPRAARGPWVAPVSFDFNELFVDGKRATRSRSPNQGYYRVDGSFLKTSPLTFKYSNNSIKKDWAERGNVEVTVLCSWQAAKGRIAAVDDVAHTVELAATGPMPTFRNYKECYYWIENAPELLDNQNEFYVDTKAGTVKYIPAQKDDPTNQERVAPFLEQLVRIKGEPENGKLVHDVVFRGFDFRHAEWKVPEKGYEGRQAASTVPAAFEAEGAENVTIDHCTFSQMGLYAVSFGRGCYRNRVTGNEIFDMGAGGVKIGELLKDRERPNEAERSGGNLVADNHMHQLGRMYPDAVGVLVGQSRDNTITHNHIHDLYFSAISVGWSWLYNKTELRNNIVEFNHLHDLGHDIMSDLGGIYTLGEQPGTVLRNNLIYDVEGLLYGGWGIYLDQSSRYMTVEKNIVYNCSHAGFNLNYGKDDLIRNNVFAFNRDYQMTRNRADMPLSLTIERNIVYFDRGPLLGNNWTGALKMDKNIYWNTQNREIRPADKSWKEWQASGMDVHSIIADPLFVNAANFDFRLKPNSPALKLGFQQIDMSTVGPRIQVGPSGMTAFTAKRAVASKPAVASAKPAVR